MARPAGGPRRPRVRARPAAGVSEPFERRTSNRMCTAVAQPGQAWPHRGDCARYAAGVHVDVRGPVRHVVAEPSLRTTLRRRCLCCLCCLCCLLACPPGPQARPRQQGVPSPIWTNTAPCIWAAGPSDLHQQCHDIKALPYAKTEHPTPSSYVWNVSHPQSKYDYEERLTAQVLHARRAMFPPAG